MSVKTDDDTEVIEHLDFEAPCSIARCDRPVEWILRYRPHCVDPRPGVALLCDSHEQDRRSYTHWKCRYCGLVRLMSDVVISIERYRP